MPYNHFIDIDKIDVIDLYKILERAKSLKADVKSNQPHQILLGQHLAMIFEKSSTRTRASFEVGINQLGGNAIIVDSTTSQLGRGESVSDTAQVLSRYVDVIMARTFSHDTVLQLAEYGTVPVINGLTDYSHPCQVMTDILTFEEHCGSIEGKIISWVGDCNNMTTSWAHGAEKFKFHLHIACPDEFMDDGFLESVKSSKYIKIFNNPQDACKNVDCITTDTWVSMGDKNAEYKKKILAPYQVDKALMGCAKPNAIFMHCLPAHREEEVTTSVIDGEQSVVFDEAENRLHMQKAIMLWCLQR